MGSLAKEKYVYQAVIELPEPKLLVIRTFGIAPNPWPTFIADPDPGAVHLTILNPEVVFSDTILLTAPSRFVEPKSEFVFI